MIDSRTAEPGTPPRNGWLHLRGTAPEPSASRSGDERPLRTGVARGMVSTLCVVAPLLVLFSLPGFLTDHRTEPLWLLVLSLCLSAVMVAALPLALVRRGEPGHTWPRVSAAAYLGLMVLEGFHLHAPPPSGSAPWLVGIACVALSALALGTDRPLWAGLGCAGIVAGITVIYVGHVSIENLVVDAVGLLAIATVLILGVSTLRRRADLADSTERSVRDLFERSQPQAAREAERVRTDALLHDSVLAALSTAASGYGTPDQTLLMARTALEVVTDTADLSDAHSLTVTFERAVAAAEHELTPMQGSIRFDLSDASTVELPVDVAEALVSAMLQALNNSIKHAGRLVDRSVTATRTRGDGIRIDISDNGCGFDPAQIAPERLGVRASILERMSLVGGNADIQSAPGSGTTVLLDWSPTTSAPPADSRTDASMYVISRRMLYGTLAVVVAIAILTAAIQIALVSRAVGPIIATVLGLVILPTMVRGARLGRMRRSTAWIVTLIGWSICLVGTIGLQAEDYDSVSIACYTCGVLAGCVMGWMAGYRLPPVLTTTILVVNVAIWAGPLGVIRLSLAGEIVVVVAGLILHRAIQRVTEAARLAAIKKRETTLWQAELDAFQLERQKRLRLVGHDAAPMLRHIIRTGGVLDQPARVQCRVLEQTLRDEIRGRLLLNDNVRSAILRHRRRGALVLLLDDGGLDDLSPIDRNELLDDVARRVEPLRSSRIVIRTGQSHDTTAITIMASTPDETAVALGLDDDTAVDLWAVIPRPVAADLAVAVAPH